MENYFKPVHTPCAPDEIKARRCRHHPHHHGDPQSHRYPAFGEKDRNSDESHGHRHHHQHGHYVDGGPHRDTHRCHQMQQFHYSEEDELRYNHEAPVTLSRASSSSLSSSTSSTSSSSWYTEASGSGPYPLCHAEQPQHSLSCSNIADTRRGTREDGRSKPIVFATIKHGKNGSVFTEFHNGSPKGAQQGFSSLDRGHSRSDEGPLQGNERDLAGERSRTQHMEYEPLYKTASLNRSLAFNEEDSLLGASGCPKRAVSSNQLPSKGILKNKEPHPDIRKAKSMEALSPRVSKAQDPRGQKNQAEIEQARANFVQGKLQFSAFLDEITKQVLSPSDLEILGVNSDKASVETPAPAQTRGPVKPRLPPKKPRESPADDGEQRSKQQGGQEAAAPGGFPKHSGCSNPDKPISYAAKNHHGGPQPHHRPHAQSHHTHHGSNHNDRSLPPARGSASGGGLHLTDGTSTSTSPDLIQPKQRRHHKPQPAASCSQHPKRHPQQGHPGPATGQGVGSESSSTKSDSSMSRDTACSADSYSQPECLGHSKPSRETECDVDHLWALQEENADLQQNLLQTVVCIERLEVELQRSRDELSGVKEKYKSLLETHAGTKKANNLLGEHLHIASESLCSERKYLLARVSQLSSELEDAHRTMAALENINVPCLIKELLEKHFSSAEATQKILKTPAPPSHSASSPPAGGQLHTTGMEEAAHEWMNPEEGPQRGTAFTPFKQNEAFLSGQHQCSHSPPFSVADISAAIYKIMAARYAARPQPRCPQSHQPPLLRIIHADDPPILQQAHVSGDSPKGKGGEKITLLEEDLVDVTSMSAQQVLDGFLLQLQPDRQLAAEKQQQQQQGGPEREDVVEPTGKVAE